MVLYGLMHGGAYYRNFTVYLTIKQTYMYIHVQMQYKTCSETMCLVTAIFAQDYRGKKDL